MRLTDWFLLLLYILVVFSVAGVIVLAAEILGFVPVVAFCIALATGVLIYDLGARNGLE